MEGPTAALALVLALAVAGVLVARVVALRRQVALLRSEADRLRDLAKGRAERISVLSHEIRTPLALVKGAGELLAEQSPGALNERQRQFVGTITQNSQHVIDMAEDLLAEARLEAKFFDLHLADTDLRALARKVVRELRRVHPSTILLDARGAPTRVAVDRGLMRQALANLINNAARHSGDAATITVRITAGDETVLVAVSDNGRGMSAAERSELFTPFAVGTTARPGTGLGMMITERIVELHGGRMFVDTVAQRGTTIFFTVPVAQ